MYCHIDGHFPVHLGQGFSQWCHFYSTMCNKIWRVTGWTMHVEGPLISQSQIKPFNNGFTCIRQDRLAREIGFVQKTHMKMGFFWWIYLVWLVITQWIGSPSVEKRAIWFGFWSRIFEDDWREVVVSLNSGTPMKYHSCRRYFRCKNDISGYLGSTSICYISLFSWCWNIAKGGDPKSLQLRIALDWEKIRLRISPTS